LEFFLQKDRLTIFQQVKRKEGEPMSDTELTVSHPLLISLDPTDVDINALLRTILAEISRAAEELLGQAVRAVERWARDREPNRWVNRGQQTRRLRTSWGEVAVRRTRVLDRHLGETYNLADRLLGWRPRVRRGVDEVRMACELAAELPYRLARHWWQRLTGQHCSVMTFWRMVQQAGERLVFREGDEVGEIRPEDPPPRAVRRVYLEADGVWIRRQKWKRRRRPAEQLSDSASTLWPRNMLLYVGISYSQLHDNGRGRRNTLDKQTLVETGNLRSFGKQWAWQVRRRFDLSRSPNQLFISDGDDGLSRLPKRHFRGALVQLDRFHVHQRLAQAFGLKTPGYRTALTALCRGEMGQVRSLLALRGTGERGQICQEVRNYLDRHESTLWTHREWKRRTTVTKMGSGVIEKTIETLINRRMKKRGMSWSPAGARRLSKLRVLYKDLDRWDAFWSRTPV
jgi:hypothetical protein